MRAPAEATLRPLGSPAEAAACARLMAGSEPWLTLGRSYERSLEIVTDPTREVSVAVRDGELAGFVIVCMAGPFIGYIQTVAVAAGARGGGIGTASIPARNGCTSVSATPWSASSPTTWYGATGSC